MFKFIGMQKHQRIQFLQMHGYSVMLPILTRYLPVYSLRCDRGTEQMERP